MILKLQGVRCEACGREGAGGELYGSTIKSLDKHLEIQGRCRELRVGMPQLRATVNCVDKEGMLSNKSIFLSPVASVSYNTYPSTV